MFAAGLLLYELCAGHGSICCVYQSGDPDSWSPDAARDLLFWLCDHTLPADGYELHHQAEPDLWDRNGHDSSDLCPDRLRRGQSALDAGRSGGERSRRDRRPYPHRVRVRSGKAVRTGMG